MLFKVLDWVHRLSARRTGICTSLFSARCHSMAKLASPAVCLRCSPRSAFQPCKVVPLRGFHLGRDCQASRVPLLISSAFSRLAPHGL